jgi:hypothetical protein
MSLSKYQALDFVLVGKKKTNKKSDNIVDIGDDLNVVDVGDGFSIVNDFDDKTSSLNFVGMLNPNNKNCISDSDSHKPNDKKCSDSDSNNLSESDDETLTLEGIANEIRNSESESETSKSEDIGDSKSDEKEHLKCSDSEETGMLDSSNLIPECSGSEETGNLISETESFQIVNGNLEEKKTDHFDSDSDERKTEVSDTEESSSQNSRETGFLVLDNLQQSVGLRICLTSNLGFSYEGTIVKILQEERSILLTDVEVSKHFL